MTFENQIHNVYQKYLNREFVQAEAGIQNLLATNPTNDNVLRLGALTALALKQVHTAHERLQKALQVSELTAETANTLGNILQASGEWSKAESAYRKALELEPTDQLALENIVDLLLQSGQPDRAILELDSQVARSSEDNLKRLARTNALINLGLYENALEVVNLINLPLKTGVVAILKVRIFYHLGRYQEMKEIAESIPANSEYAVDALNIVVNAYTTQGDWAAAQSAIETACSPSDAPPEIFVTSANLATRNGQDTFSKIMITQAVDQFGAQADILAAQAHKAMKDKTPKLSYKLFKQALSLKHNDFSIMLGTAQAALVLEKYDECQNLIQSAFNQSPNNQLLLALTASLQRARGENHHTLFNYDHFVRLYDLQAPPGYSSIETFNADLKSRLNELHLSQSAPINQSFRGGTQTDIDLFFINDPILKAFFSAIDAPIRDYIEVIGNQKNHPLSRRNTGQYRINGSWSVRLSPHGHHMNHVHSLGWISSSYYVDIPDVVENSNRHEGWIKFGEPGIIGLNHKVEKFIRPRAGQLLLFPSYMWHGTVPFSGKHTRMTLPFDIVPR
ncbi:MAG: hypothetical protein COB36_12870 [Alphaproteobacteria bacterium]|nr:MAG: hypothetical protein COB36_12870 [Alphaproteobacteria bacterium]